MIGFRSTSANGTTSKDSTGSPSEDLAGNLRTVASEVTELVELQADLFAVDSRATLRTLAVPFALVVGGALVAATASLLGFAGIAVWLHAEQGWPLAPALLVVSGGALLFGVGCVASAALLVRWWGIPLMRSFRELRLNLAWIRRALLGTGHSRN